MSAYIFLAVVRFNLPSQLASLDLMCYLFLQSQRELINYKSWHRRIDIHPPLWTIHNHLQQQIDDWMMTEVEICNSKSFILSAHLFPFQSVIRPTTSSFQFLIDPFFKSEKHVFEKKVASYFRMVDFLSASTYIWCRDGRADLVRRSSGAIKAPFFTN